MTNIENYLDDGANYQAQCVLAYMRPRIEWAFEGLKNIKMDRYGTYVSVGRYENCREQGYVFTLHCDNKCGYKMRHYAVYEHRNCDSIIVLISNKICINTPSVDDMWVEKGENASKYDYDKAFSYMDIKACSDWIIEDMNKFLKKIDDEIESKKDESV